MIHEQCMQSTSPSSVSSIGLRRSYVPEHVRRPQAFTCYTLEAPLVVGSGNNGSSGAEWAEGQAEASQFAGPSISDASDNLMGEASGQEAGLDVEMAEGSTCEPGTIEFLPRAGAGHHNMLATDVREKSSALLVSFQDGDTMEEPGEGVAEMYEVPFPRGKMQRRRLRARTSHDDDNDDGDDDEEAAAAAKTCTP
jgi:hypothetical protein